MNDENGSPGGIRTPDRVINSHLLCRLSYRGILKERKNKLTDNFSNVLLFHTQIKSFRDFALADLRHRRDC